MSRLMKTPEQITQPPPTQEICTPGLPVGDAKQMHMMFLLNCILTYEAGAEISFKRGFTEKDETGPRDEAAGSQPPTFSHTSDDPNRDPGNGLRCFACDIEFPDQYG
ncbi:hypothetical protein JTE90_019301 [Oedothorax gibbosus]|uniref:Uncharacterized protein n=1 Tax=Oedothorax gibbosus TaxID=931172 RepID=A0AAV6UV97_9ARAC|nr:hypothetical protein JTE90_019301 [Oedothorax gibbosus]